MQILEAELPSGVWTFPTGLRVSTRAGLAEELLDVFYGPRRVGAGTGRVRVQTRGGRYLIERDLATGRARITPCGHARPPDASVEPGQWLLGRGREELEGLRALPDPDLDPPAVPPWSAWIRAQLAHLKRSAARIATQDDGAAGCEDPLAPLARTAAGLFGAEAQALREAAAREAVIAGVLRALKDPERLLKASAHAARLRELGAKLRAFPDTASSGATLARSQVTLVVLATCLAGLAAVGAGALLEAALLGQGGALLALGTLSPWVAWRLRRRRSQRNTERRLSDVRAEAQAALVRAQVLPGDGGPTPELLEEASLRVAHRDNLQRVRQALEGLLPAEGQRDVRARRLDILVRGVPDEITLELADLASREPLLALPGLLRRCREALAADQEIARRKGAAAALQQEARLLEQGLAAPRAAAREAFRAAVLEQAAGRGGWPVFVSCDGAQALVRTMEALRDLPAGVPLILTTPGDPNPARTVLELDPRVRGEACLLAPEPLTERHATRPAAH